MATSVAHQVGELIGDFFEAAIIRYLSPIIHNVGNYYLDYKHPRQARNNETILKGVDSDGNEHRLDIVIEKGGTEETFGSPKAYIEIAWRRYKKHSKNKVQEIQGAIMPLVRTYAAEIPFYAAVLAGEFTNNSLDQLKSLGFYVLYFTYEEISNVFLTEGISIQWQEHSSENELNSIADQLRAIDMEKRERLINTFICQQSAKLQRLTDELKEALEIVITEVRITPVHGRTKSLANIRSAVGFMIEYDEDTVQPLMRYEISIRYSNGQEYTMKCITRRQGIQFLNKYMTD